MGYSGFFSKKRLFSQQNEHAPEARCVGIKRRNMKKKTWIYLVLIVLCVAVLIGYRAWSGIRKDSVKPEIIFNEEPAGLSVLDPQSALLQGVAAQDDRDGDVTDSLVVESIQLVDPQGIVRVSYAAFDKAGNVTKAERELRYTDYQGPRFVLDRALAFTQNASVNLLSVVTAQDGLDGDITYRIRATSLDEASVSALGTHPVEFRVTNSLGDTVKLVFPVEVYPSGLYEAELALSDYLVYLDAGAAFDPDSYLLSYTRNMQTTSLANGLPRNFSADIVSDVDTKTPGVYTVTYKVTQTVENDQQPDSSKNYTGYSKLIVVVEG